MNRVNKSRQDQLQNVRERCGKVNGRGDLVRRRKEITHVRPLSHNISLLSELPATSDIQLCPPAHSGVAFTLDSGCYNPHLTHPWKKRRVERIVSCFCNNMNLLWYPLCYYCRKGIKNCCPKNFSTSFSEQLSSIRSILKPLEGT